MRLRVFSSSGPVVTPIAWEDGAKHSRWRVMRLSNIARPLLAFAGSWTSVLMLRSVDRVGKGLRSAPRDALVADVTPAHIKGYAFGFHRALDNSGAVGGGLVAAAILAWSGLPLAQVILLSAIPGFLAVVLVVFGVREAPAAPIAVPPTLAPLRWSDAVSRHAALSAGAGVVHVRARLGDVHRPARLPDGDRYG